MTRLERQAAKRLRAIEALIEAAREIRRVHDAQVKYTRELQELAAEARRTGVSQSHRIGPRVHDYGNGVDALLAALEVIVQPASALREGQEGKVPKSPPKTSGAAPKKGEP